VEIEPFLQNVHEELDAAGGGTDAEAAAAARIARALDPALRLALLDATSRMALELSERIPAGHVEVRLAGRDVELVYVNDEPAPRPPEESEETGTARITFRVPESLKARIEVEASSEGISTNAWLVHAVTRSLSQTAHHRRTGRRITGFAES
jgi:HicB family